MSSDLKKEDEKQILDEDTAYSLRKLELHIQQIVHECPAYFRDEKKVSELFVNVREQLNLFNNSPEQIEMAEEVLRVQIDLALETYKEEQKLKMSDIFLELRKKVKDIQQIVLKANKDTVLNMSRSLEMLSWFQMTIAAEISTLSLSLSVRIEAAEELIAKEKKKN
jgi:hypothetical protein